MFENYIQLLGKIDAFVAGVTQKHPGSFRCGPGCAKCCVDGITVWRVEADHIKEYVNRLGAGGPFERRVNSPTTVACDARRRGAGETPASEASSRSEKGSAAPSHDSCIFLDGKNLCTIYEARPVVCRLWGAPLMIPAGREGEWGMRDHTSAERERGTLTCCDLNFQENLKLEELPIEDAINVETAIRTLAAINHVYCEERGLDPEARIDLPAIHQLDS